MSFMAFLLFLFYIFFCLLFFSDKLMMKAPQFADTLLIRLSIFGADKTWLVFPNVHFHCVRQIQFDHCFMLLFCHCTKWMMILLCKLGTKKTYRESICFNRSKWSRCSSRNWNKFSKATGCKLTNRFPLIDKYVSFDNFESCWVGTICKRQTTKYG